MLVDVCFYACQGTTSKRSKKQKYRKKRDNNDISINIMLTEISFQQETFDTIMNDNGATTTRKESEEKTANKTSTIKSSKIAKDIELVLQS